MTVMHKSQKLPGDVTAYKTTEPFTAQSVPKALLAMHRTKHGVWGRIDVLGGNLTLSWFEADGTQTHTDVLKKGDQAVVAPQQPHAVALSDDGRFTVTFFKAQNRADQNP